MSRVAEEPAGNDTLVGIVTGSGEGRRAYNRIVWTLGILAAVAFVIALMKPLIWPLPLAKQAEKIMTLPTDAHVVKVSDGQMRQVWFTLPEPKGPGSRADELWGLNGAIPISPPPPAGTGSATSFARIRTRTARSAKSAPSLPFTKASRQTYRGKATLEYDRKTHRYHYQTTDN